MSDLVGGTWVDNHCHLDHRGRDAALVDPAELIDEAVAAGVVAMVTVGTDLPASRRARELAVEHRSVFATAGVHPHEASGGVDGLAELIAEDRGGARPVVVAVGECGLDYHYDHSPRATQREVFARQVDMANENGLPLVIHTRDAWDDTFAVLDDGGVPARTVFHCFTGGPAEAERCLERDALLSVSGIVTFPGATELADAVRLTPLDSLMVETDSPYLAPVPHRGRTNRPANVAIVGAAVAELLGRRVEDVARVTTSTADAFYGLGLTDR